MALEPNEYGNVDRIAADCEKIDGDNITKVSGSIGVTVLPYRSGWKKVQGRYHPIFDGYAVLKRDVEKLKSALNEYNEQVRAAKEKKRLSLIANAERTPRRENAGRSETLRSFSSQSSKSSLPSQQNLLKKSPITHARSVAVELVAVK